MNIASIDFSLKTKSLDIYVAGCNGPYCKGCHNHELFNFDVGEKYTIDFFKTKLRLISFHYSLIIL